jgi:membrane-associated phospholipid phosphatase
LNFNRIAFAISVALHPLLLPTLCFFVLLYITPLAALQVKSEARVFILSAVFILTFVAPALGIMLFYLTGQLNNLTMADRTDRQLPFVMTTFFYWLATYFFMFGRGFRDLPILGVIVGSVSVSLALVSIITFYWKISAHSVGMSGVVGFLLGLTYKYGAENLLIPLIISILLTGLLMTSRLQLNAHQPAQILAGSALGFFISFLSIVLFL